MSDASPCPACSLARDACECRVCPQCKHVAMECECPRCPRCRKVEAACECPPCSYCQRTAFECYVRVDERFPADARRAYERAGYVVAPTCEDGLRWDVNHVTGDTDLAWCMDRVIRHKEWTGPRSINGLEVQGSYGSRSRARSLRDEETQVRRARDIEERQ